jgi:hypothetical protein
MLGDQGQVCPDMDSFTSTRHAASPKDYAAPLLRRRARKRGLHWRSFTRAAGTQNEPVTRFSTEVRCCRQKPGWASVRRGYRSLFLRSPGLVP